MTPKRKQALQWYLDNPQSALKAQSGTDSPSLGIAIRMASDGELDMSKKPDWWPENYKDMVRFYPCELTDLGRRRLHGDDV